MPCPSAAALKIGFLRSLMRARYAVEPLGHYGLAKKEYTHFTSPIRRYADLVVHRALFQGSHGPTHSLKETADHISETERNSADAERDSKDVKLYAFLRMQLQSADPPRYPALVIDVRNFGFFVDVPGLAMSGLVHLSSVLDDFYVFDPERNHLIGRRQRRVIRLGDKVEVQIAKVDSFKKQVDFRLATNRADGTARPAKSTVSRPKIYATSLIASAPGIFPAVPAGDRTWAAAGGLPASCLALIRNVPARRQRSQAKARTFSLHLPNSCILITWMTAPPRHRHRISGASVTPAGTRAASRKNTRNTTRNATPTPLPRSSRPAKPRPAPIARSWWWKFWKCLRRNPASWQWTARLVTAATRRKFSRASSPVDDCSGLTQTRLSCRRLKPACAPSALVRRFSPPIAATLPACRRCC